MAPELWPDAIQGICEVSGSFGGVLFAKNLDCSGWVTSPALVKLFQEFVEDGWAARNPRPSAVIQRKATGFVACHELFPSPEGDADPVKGFLLSKGLGWSAGMVTPVPSGDLLVFSFERLFEDGPYTRELLNGLDRLSPHLKRATLIAARLGFDRAKGAAETLASIGLPAAVLSRSNKLLAANELMAQFTPRLIQDRGKRVKIAHPRADEIFEQALIRIQCRCSCAGTVLSIPIKGTSERKPLILHVVPIRRAAQDIFSAASCLIVITEVSKNAGPEAEILQGLFDLTPAEARVARALAAGRQVKEIAVEHQVSQETVRSQAKSIFAKSGISRQAELTAMLGRIFVAKD